MLKQCNAKISSTLEYGKNLDYYKNVCTYLKKIAFALKENFGYIISEFLLRIWRQKLLRNIVYESIGDVKESVNAHTKG